MEPLVSIGMEVSVSNDNGINVNPVVFGDLELMYPAFKFMLVSMLLNGIDVDNLMSEISKVFEEDGILSEMTKFEAENKTKEMTREEVQKMLIDKACQMLAIDVATIITGVKITDKEVILEKQSTLAADLGIENRKIIV